MKKPQLSIHSKRFWYKQYTTDNPRKSAAFIEIFQKPTRNWEYMKVLEHLRFHLMKQSTLRLRANNKF